MAVLLAPDARATVATRMAQIRPRDLYSFRRMLFVLLATVVVPVVVLSGIGFLAVKNERAAIEREVTQTFAPRLEELSLALARTTDTPTSAEAQRLADATFGPDGTRYRVEPAGAEGAVVAARLAPPHESMQVGVYEPFGRSITGRLVRNRAVYISLIILFFASVVTGVVIIGRAWYINQRLARLQNDFVSNVSHELRTPLTSIRMFVETLQMDRARDPAQVKECLDLLAGETERLSHMIERMLSWARMEAGRRVYTLEPVRVGVVVEKAVNAFRAQRLVGPAPKLSVDVPPEIPEIQADTDAIAEALLNLLTNAFKYGGEDKKIALRARNEGGSIVLEVEDDGIGIAPRDRKRIFDKFYRAEQLLSRNTEGIGLGLSIVRHIVEGHQGRIECNSEPGKGTTFRILLSRAPTEETARTPSGATRAATNATP